jgi:large-conductance mechanosensitive channel
MEVATTVGETVANVGENVLGATTNVLSNSVELVKESTSSFTNLMKDFNVIGFALGLIIANNIGELANAFIDGIIMPTLKPILDRVSGGNKTEFKLGSITINLDKLIQSLIKFVAIGIVIYIMIRVGIQISKPIQWVSIREVAEGVKLA